MSDPTEGNLATYECELCGGRFPVSRVEDMGDGEVLCDSCYRYYGGRLTDNLDFSKEQRDFLDKLNKELL